MTRRYFSNSAVLSYITTSLNGVDTESTFSVSATSGGATAPPTGWPSVPFYAAINRGAADEEVVLVTAVSGSSVTCTRGSTLTSPYGSTTQTHTINATIEHVASAAEYDEANAHIEATAAHGATGAVMGTTNTQTATNKTLTAPVLNTPTITAPVIGATAWTDANHTHAGATTGGQVAHDALSGLTTGDPHTQYQKESEKGAISGYASLDADTKVPYAQLPTGTAASTVAIGDHTHGYTFSGAKAVRTADQSLTDSTWEEMKWTGTDDYDTDSYHNPASLSGVKLTIPVTGYYRILCQVVWEGSATGRRVLDLRLNDTSTDATAGSSLAKVHEVPAVAVACGQQIACEGYFSAGDYIKLLMWHNSGSPLTILGTGVTPVFGTIHRLG